MKSRLKAIIYGVVQGVGFRYFVLGQALKAAISGFVRNLPDGTVEIEAEGAEDDLDQFIESIKSGPPGAVVKEIEIERKRYTGEYRGFNIKH